MADSDQFDLQAARFRAEAAEATLDNVRDRCLRSAAAWEARAATSRRTETSRAQRAAATAAASALAAEPASGPAGE